jgi:hypothetical protein
MALCSGSKKSTQSDSNSDFDDEVRDELVGDSHKGPLKNRGILLKTCKKRKHTSNLTRHTHSTAHAAVPRGPPKWHNKALPRARPASLEGLNPLE